MVTEELRAAPATAPRRRGALPALLVCLGAALWLTKGMLRHPASVWVGHGGDPILFVWFLRWVPWALAHGHDPLLTTHLRYPGGANLMWNTSVLLAGALLWPVTATLGPVASLNLLVLLGFTASGWCAYLAARRFVASFWAALAAALVYELSPFLTTHARGHDHLVLAFVPPLLLLLGDELLVRQRWPPWRLGGALGGLVAAQVLLAEELAATEALLAAIAVALLAALYPGQVRARLRYAVAGLAVAVAVAAVLLAVPLAVQFAGPGRVHGPIQASDVYVSDALGFVVPGPFQWHLPGWPRPFPGGYPYSGNASEWTAYLGVPLLLLLAGVTVACWRRPIVRLASLLLAAAAVLSLGPHLHVAGHTYAAVKLPWRLLQLVPLVGDLEPGRLTLYVDLLAALLVAVLLDAALRQPRWPLRLGLTALVLLALLSYLPAAPLETGRARVPAFFTGPAVGAVPDGAVVLLAPFPTGPYSTSAMLWQALAGMRFRLPGGYLVAPGPDGRPTFEPPATLTSATLAAIHAGRPAPPLTPDLRRRLLDELAAWRVGAVVVGPMAHRGEAVRFLSGLLGSAPTATAGVDLWRLPGGSGALPPGG